MKYILFVVFGLVFTTAGFWGGLQYEISEQQYRSEAIIGREVALLEQHKGIPDCLIAQSSVNQPNTERAKGALVIWYYDQPSDILKRLVLDQEFNTAYEEIGSYCRTNN